MTLEAPALVDRTRLSQRVFSFVRLVCYNHRYAKQGVHSTIRPFPIRHGVLHILRVVVAPEHRAAGGRRGGVLLPRTDIMDVPLGDGNTPARARKRGALGYWPSVGNLGKLRLFFGLRRLSSILA